MDGKQPKVGDFMIHVEGEGHDDLFDTVEQAREAAKAEKGGFNAIPVLILQIVDIA